MTCEQCRALMPEFLNADTAANSAPDLQYDLHLDSCPACRAESARLEAMWRALGDLPDPPAPPPSLRARFYENLSAYQQGAAESRPRRAATAPLWKFALTAAASLAVGFLIAHSLDRAADNTAQLRSEVAAMRQMVALSLLQQQSAGDRLKGVSWAYRIESPNPQPDTEVLSALLSTVNHDSSVNVRLAAVDALRAFAASPIARKGLVQAIPKQDSPMVQIALIDQLAELRDPSAVPALTALAADAAANKDVRQRAHWALEKLQ